MKVGSLVVCVKPYKGDIGFEIIKDKIYTVRYFDNSNSKQLGIYLEEVINPINQSLNIEYSYKIERFRELDTPTEIKLENILELEIV